MDPTATFSLLLIPIMIVALIFLWRFFITQDRKELEESDHVIRMAQEAEEAEIRAQRERGN